MKHGLIRSHTGQKGRHCNNLGRMWKRHYAHPHTPCGGAALGSHVAAPSSSSRSSCVRLGARNATQHTFRVLESGVSITCCMLQKI